MWNNSTEAYSLFQSNVNYYIPENTSKYLLWILGCLFWNRRETTYFYNNPLTAAGTYLQGLISGMHMLIGHTYEPVTSMYKHAKTKTTSRRYFRRPKSFQQVMRMNLNIRSWLSRHLVEKGSRFRSDIYCLFELAVFNLRSQSCLVLIWTLGRLFFQWISKNTFICKSRWNTTLKVHVDKKTF